MVKLCNLLSFSAFFPKILHSFSAQFPSGIVTVLILCVVSQYVCNLQIKLS